MLTGKNYIGNEMTSSGLVKFKTINPKTNTENETIFTEASKEEIDAAVRLSAKAFKTYRKTSNKERAAFLNAIADEINKLGHELIDLYCSESGLPEGRAEGEKGRTMAQLRAFSEMLTTTTFLDSSIQLASDAKPDLRKTQIPIGPVVVFGASNFPLAFSTAGGDTASALAAGCTVIVKSHPMHAGTGELISGAILRAAQKTNMPNGIFSNLNSQGIDVGVQLVKHPAVKAVGFTGSLQGGRALFDLAQQRAEPIPVFAEMGSINPLVISQGALVKSGTDWATQIAGSVALGTGQFCTKPGLILAVKSNELEQFKVNLSKELDALAPACMLHPNIQRKFEENAQELISQNGVSTSTKQVETIANHANQVLAVTSGADFYKNIKLQEEVFGPFCLLIECESETQLIEIIDALAGQLTGTIIAESEEKEWIEAVTDSLGQKVGRLIYNGVPTGVDVSQPMNHGGPYPASTDSRYTSVGLDAVKRWIRPLSFQNFPTKFLPSNLK